MVGSRKGQLLEEQENSSSVPAWQRASSVPAHKRPLIVSAKGSSSAGSVSDEAFQRAFTEVPKCNVFSPKQLKDQIGEACAILENTDLDWSRRMTALKTLRAVIIGGGLDYSDFSEEVREMQAALLTSVKDLRSQLCREACVTIAFYCERLGLVMVSVIEALMPTLISLMQNSAKVMATSAQLALQYVVKHVCSARLLPHLQTAMSSKSKEIRRNTASLFLMALTLWDNKTVEKNMNIFLECIKASINDADPETRRTGRALFMQLDQEYKKQADVLYKTLDPSRQRTLSGFVSQSSSSQSIISERDALPVSQRNAAYVLHKASPSYYAGRSTSDIDPGAVRRVTNRAVRTASKWSGPLQQVNGTPSTTQMRTNAAQRLSSASQKYVSSLRRVPPTPTNYVRSQPGSRSTSPASRFPARAPPRSQMSSRTKIKTDESEDHASISSDSFRFETMELTTALSCCGSSSTTEKKEGLKALFTIISSDKQISTMDLKKIVERLNPLIGEGAHKLLQPLADTLIALVRCYHEELNDWLNLLIPKLVAKCSTDVLPSNLEKYRFMTEAVRTSFDPEKQLHAVCKFIRDPVRNNVNVKIKHGLLMYLHDLMRGMDSAPSMNQSEVRQAISEKVVCDMFHLNASDFTSMLATFPNDLKDRLQTIIRRNSFFLSASNGINSNEARAGILETTAQINDFVDRRAGLPMSSPRGSPQLMNGSVRSSFDGPPLRRASREDQSGSLSGYILDPQGFANDPEQQEELITKIGEELSLHNQRSEERQRAMSVLSQITRDNLFSLWDKHFKMIFLLLIETLKDNDESIRRMALKLLKEICYAQASRFNEFAEMALMRVLDACTDESKLVVTAAEECGGVLATHVSSATCRRVLLAIIKSDVGEPKIHIAIKLLTKVIESLSAAELELILDEVAPPIVDTYNYVSSSIRKESVVCLVAMIMLVGEEHMAPYLSELNKGKQKLIEVYVKRMKGIFE
uniref:CLASP_N domain-containing protein n=1 Tax=Elaeophora elaphi TaxID=1147741 RepID=A0A0R3RYT9_9BILA